jgi:hypothetical protein
VHEVNYLELSFANTGWVVFITPVNYLEL